MLVDFVYPHEFKFNFLGPHDNRDDRAYWMYKVSRVEPLYLDKVEVFLEAAQKDAWNKQLAEINYPCRDCKNLTLFPLA